MNRHTSRHANKSFYHDKATSTLMTIVITLPTFFHGEAEHIVQFLHGGRVNLIHIRKPGATVDEVENLILNIPVTLRHRLVIHDHFQLAQQYALHGIHLNSRNPSPPDGWQGSISRSCHSIEELIMWKERCNYLSLSPIFDSISKRGYRSAFTPDIISSAHNKGIIDKKVLALGGVTFDNITTVIRMGFGGAMILGDAWKEKPSTHV